MGKVKGINLPRASINLRNILDVSEKEQLVSLETTLRLFWKVTYSALDTIPKLDPQQNYGSKFQMFCVNENPFGDKAWRPPSGSSGRSAT